MKKKIADVCNKDCPDNVLTHEVKLLGSNFILGGGKKQYLGYH